MIWKLTKFGFFAWLGSIATYLHLATGGIFGDALLGVCVLFMTATFICEDWLDAFEAWVAKVCGYNPVTNEDRMARAVEILENTYGQDCGDVASIDQAIDILKGGYYPPKATEASQ